MNTVGWGFDAHRFGGSGPLLLAGVVADPGRGLLGRSDGDVAAHAVADALLGATALDDLGAHFPAEDVSDGADSMEMLASVVARCRAAGLTINHLDVTVIGQTVRVSPIRDEMRRRLSEVLDVELSAVSVKATTTDGMGFAGLDEGMAAAAIVAGDR